MRAVLFMVWLVVSLVAVPCLATVAPGPEAESADERSESKPERFEEPAAICRGRRTRVIPPGPGRSGPSPDPARPAGPVTPRHGRAPDPVRAPGARSSLPLQT